MSVFNRGLSTFDIATLNGSSRNHIQNLVEAYLQHERELAVWSYPHFVRYLREMIYKLTPNPHRCVRAVFDAANEILAEQCAPRLLGHLHTTPPDHHGNGRIARIAANGIVAVIGCWAGFNGIEKIAVHNAEDRYQRARNVTREVEAIVLERRYLTPDELYQCAIAASTDTAVDDNRRDAALAAMSAGHFKLAHEIVTDKG